MRLSGTLDIDLGDGPKPATFVDICVGTFNPKNNKGVYQFDEVWTLPDGTFEGTAHVKVSGGSLLTMEYTSMIAHIILHGTGVYEGQILSLRSDEPGGFPAYIGYVLTP